MVYTFILFYCAFSRSYMEKKLEDIFIVYFASYICDI